MENLHTFHLPKPPSDPLLGDLYFYGRAQSYTYHISISVEMEGRYITAKLLACLVELIDYFNLKFWEYALQRSSTAVM